MGRARIKSGYEKMRCNCKQVVSGSGVLEVGISQQPATLAITTRSTWSADRFLQACGKLTEEVEIDMRFGNGIALSNSDKIPGNYQLASNDHSNPPPVQLAMLSSLPASYVSSLSGE